ncbi:MAG: NAD(P)H-dependent oxidoreductase [Nitrospirota bacterium]
MKIVVLNGSPKGNISVTMQYVNFIQKNFPIHELKIIQISQNIKKIEEDEKSFQEILEEIRSSGGVLWAFPVYYMLVHSHYKRFIEIISEKGAEHIFRDKYTALLTTSIHFYDHTAHNYMNAISDDLGMRYTGSFSAEMYDLLKDKERERLLLFAENFFESIENNIITSKNYTPLIHKSVDYIPDHTGIKIDDRDKKIVIVTDAEDSQINLVRMIERFKRSYLNHIEVINLHKIDIKAGCQGCLSCGYNYQCIYRDRDDYIEFYNTKIKTADILIFAGQIKDRYLSSRWKLFFDRSFFNTHTPSLIGKQIGYIISGPLSQIPNLRQILDAYTEGQQANLVDFITDEYEDSAKIDALLQSLAKRVVRFADQNYIKSKTFLSIGGMKIFRDDIWGRLRFIFQADHKFYKRHGIYDFPQKDIRTRISNAMMILLTKQPSFRKEFTKRIKTEMIKPLQKVLSCNYSANTE